MGMPRAMPVELMGGRESWELRNCMEAAERAPPPPPPIAGWLSTTPETELMASDPVERPC